VHRRTAAAESPLPGFRRHNRFLGHVNHASVPANHAVAGPIISANC
jgi:hypothetical protein